MVSYPFFLSHDPPSRSSSLLTAREEERLRARHRGKGGCFTESKPDGAGLCFADTGREWKQAGEEAAGAREAGRGTAERDQQARAAFGHPSHPGLAADSGSGAGLSQKQSQATSETIIAASGKFSYVPGESFACAFLGSVS